MRIWTIASTARMRVMGVSLGLMRGSLSALRLVASLLAQGPERDRFLSERSETKDAATPKK
jgi:hypothetical protein